MSKDLQTSKNKDRHYQKTKKKIPKRSLERYQKFTEEE